MSDLNELPMSILLMKHPCIRDFFRSIGLGRCESQRSLRAWVSQLEDEEVLDAGMDRQHMLAHIERLLTEMETLKNARARTVRKLTILGGHDKTGNPESVRIEASAGQVVCVVGSTGSGKSRLLADIECLAQNDTPTGRTVLVDGAAPEPDTRFSLDQKVVAQLSQNMNFVVDLSVRDFIVMHAQCRMVSDADTQVAEVISCANRLAGERFAPEVSVTQLSGGQARALMIADAALLSASPIVLIDELENAGIDRKQALDLLVTGNKIVFISTHDPLLALRGHLRIMVRNGAIADVLTTSDAERKNLESIEAVDARLSAIRERLRQGQRIEEPLAWP